MTIEQTFKRISNELKEYGNTGLRFYLRLKYKITKYPPIPGKDSNAHEVRIYLDGPKEALDDVTEVVYQFPPPLDSKKVITEGTEPLEMTIWKEFRIRAIVHFNRGPPLTLTRYLKF